MSGLQQQWQQIKTELQEKPLLAMAVVMLGVLGWLYIYLGLLDTIDERKQALASEQTYYNQLVENAGDESVFELRDKMAATLSAYRNQARKGNSEGLLQASFADDIRSILRSQYLDNMDVKVDIVTTPDTENWPQELGLMTATVSVRGDRKKVLDSWVALSENLPGAWFESLKVGDINSPLVTWQMSSLILLNQQESGT